MKNERLSIVNENDEVIGEEDRSVIHRDGLLHREIHVWFLTPDKKLIFQKRGLDKETYPGLLDATVGGHVDIGESYEQAAVREAVEETGVTLSVGDLVFLKNNQSKSYDELTNTMNVCFRKIFAYVYSGDVKNLKLEDEGALGFDTFSLDEMKNLSDEEKKKFIARFVTNEALIFYQEMIDKVNENQN